MKQTGISLLELLVVIVVLLILAMVSYFAIGSKIAQGRDARRKSDLDRIKIAMYDYIFENECFPEQLPDCGQAFESNGVVYLSSMPCDLNGNPYIYVKQTSDCPIWFRIFTKLEYEKDRSIETNGCNFGCGPDCEYNYGVASTNTKPNIGCVTYYVCPPGRTACQAYADPQRSNCPKVFENDSTCGGINCMDNANREYRCENASGKYVPWKTEFY